MTAALNGPVPASWVGLAVALGCGLLIGLERERRKRQRGPDAAHGHAGIRTFAVVALLGGLAQTLGQPLLVAAGATAVLVLTALAYRDSLRRSRDPGLTTEVALVATYLIGVMAVPRPDLAAAAAVATAVLLAARQRLHVLATRWLTEAELHDGLMLAALALVLLPLSPAGPQAWLAGLVPRHLVWLWVLILLLQALGHVLLRMLGPKAGLVLAGAAAGFVSSTACIAASGARARAEPVLGGALAVSAVASTVATWVQATVMLGLLAPAVLVGWVPLALAGSGTAMLGCLAVWRLVPKRTAAPTAPAESAAPAGAGPAAAQKGPLLVRDAAAMALMLAATASLAAWAQRQFGPEAAAAGLALAALADAHAPVAAWATLQASGQATAAEAVRGALLAMGANSLSRAVLAFASGGRAFGWRITSVLAASLGAAAGVYWSLG
ncbi:MAG: DUF4010 domain-containing protein [Aquabacterium sp.]